MSIQAIKLEFIQEFLEIQNEEVILHLQKLMKLENNSDMRPMTIEELNHRIDQSESDFEKNKFKSNAEMISKYT
jgi:CII-binding regulator of phage lambda lysogenization HflD